MKLIDKMNVEKTLKITAVVLLVVNIIGLVHSYMGLLDQNIAYSNSYRLINGLSMGMHLVKALFEPMVLLGLSELIKLKK